MTAQELIEEVLKEHSERRVRCVTCGSKVGLYSADEGTNSYKLLLGHDAAPKLARMMKMVEERMIAIQHTLLRDDRRFSTEDNVSIVLVRIENTLIELDRIANEDSK